MAADMLGGVGVGKWGPYKTQRKLNYYCVYVEMMFSLLTIIIMGLKAGLFATLI